MSEEQIISSLPMQMRKKIKIQSQAGARNLTEV